MNGNQKFKPSILLEKKLVEVTQCAVAAQPGGAARLTLGEASRLTGGAEFHNWASLLSWDMREAAARLEQHRPTPMDLEIEFQEEVFVTDWQPGEQRESEEGYDLLPIQTNNLTFEVRLDRGPSGVPVHDVMTKPKFQAKVERNLWWQMAFRVW